MPEPRYKGARCRIAFGAYDGVQKFAVIELQMMLQRRVPYVVEVLPSAAVRKADDVYLFLVGTVGNNHLIAELAARGPLKVPDRGEAYTLAVLDSPWAPSRRMFVIAGADPAGVLYGTADFNARVLASLPAPPYSDLPSALQSVAVTSVSEYPLVPTRGVWTWGYVIYDYRRLFDHMARLRMNSIICWNDCLPVNCADFISYARARGISVILGFHWGWGTDLDITKAGDRLAIKDGVLERYRRDYAGLDIDGIYFQTLTEHSETTLAGRTTASWACQLVNEVSRALLDDAPDIRIYFGLHATSIREEYRDLAPLDPRVTIVWEDAGAVPFSYDPLAAVPWPSPDAPALDAAGTLDYAKRLASLRPGGTFAMVPKGWTCIDWRGEFEHHGHFILGERGRDFTRRRLLLRQPRWDFVNSLWLENFPLAGRCYREMLSAADGSLAAWGLIEDGLLEEAIQPAVSLFAETLWNPERSDREILARAMSPYYNVS